VAHPRGEAEKPDALRSSAQDGGLRHTRQHHSGISRQDIQVTIFGDTW